MSIDWQAILAGFTYKPGVRVAVVDQLGRQVLQIWVNTVDSRSETPKPMTIVHPTEIPDWVTDEATAKAFVRHCVRELELHEVDEWLRFDGQLLCDPHLNDLEWV